MKSLERVHGTTGIKIIIGSAFFWAWLDALFMSMFFVRPEAEGFMAEMATIAVFGLSLPWLALSLAKPAACNGLLAKKRVPLAFAALGTAGSLLLLLAGINLNWIALVAGGTCAGAFMAAYQLAWGAAYCHDGERSATPYVAGGFACAIVVDAPLLFMIPEAAAVFSALLPLVSGALFASIDPQLRTYRRTAPVDPLPKRSVRSRLKAHLGTSMMLLCAVALVMTGFGYRQRRLSQRHPRASRARRHGGARVRHRRVGTAPGKRGVPRGAPGHDRRLHADGVSVRHEPVLGVGRHHHQRLHDPRPAHLGRLLANRLRAVARPAENHRAHAAAGRAVLPGGRRRGHHAGRQRRDDARQRGGRDHRLATSWSSPPCCCSAARTCGC